MPIRPLKTGFQVDVCVGGVRIKRTFPTYELARTNEKEFRKALKSGESILDVDGFTDHEFTLKSILRETYKRCWAGQKTARASLRNAERVVEIIGETEDIRKINLKTIDRLVDVLKLQGLANGSINRNLAALSKLITFSWERGMIPSKVKIPKMKEFQGRVRYLSNEEESAMITRMKQLGQEIYADVIVFLLDTGCRTGELWKLKEKDVSGDVVTFWDTKSGYARSVPLTKRAAEVSARILPSLGKDNKTYWNFLTYWHRAASDIGLAHDDQFVPHACRHTCCTRLIQRGVDIRAVMEWMGHRNIKTTLRYMHLSPNGLSFAKEVLELETR